MVVSFEWPDEPPPQKRQHKKGKKRKAAGGDGEEAAGEHAAAAANKVNGSSNEDEGTASAAKAKGFAAVTGRWSNDITIYRGRVGADCVAAVLKGINPNSKNARSFNYGHRGVIYSLEVIGTSPRLTLASASIDGTVRTWELYSASRNSSGKDRYVLKRPRKGAGDWTCASVVEMSASRSSLTTPTQIQVIEPNATIAVKCDDRIRICLREGDGPTWSCAASFDTKGVPYSLCVVSSTELWVGCQDGSLEVFWHENSSNPGAWCQRGSDVTLKVHTKAVNDIKTLTLPFGQVIVSLSHDKTVRLWQKIARDNGTCAYNATTLKGFNSLLSHLTLFPERQEMAVYSDGCIFILRIDQKEGDSRQITARQVAKLKTGGMICATKLSSNAMAVGFMNQWGASKAESVQVWRRDVESGEWTASEKDAIVGLPNSTWKIFKETSGDGSMELYISGGGGSGPSFMSTWKEAKDGKWEEVETVLTKEY